jgi:hypothetical protein
MLNRRLRWSRKTNYTIFYKQYAPLGQQALTKRIECLLLNKEKLHKSATQQKLHSSNVAWLQKFKLSFLILYSSLFFKTKSLL